MPPGERQGKPVEAGREGGLLEDCRQGWSLGLDPVLLAIWAQAIVRRCRMLARLADFTTVQGKGAGFAA